MLCMQHLGKKIEKLGALTKTGIVQVYIKVLMEEIIGA